MIGKENLFTNLGFGLGLRGSHIPEILKGQSKAQWFEALSENYMGIPGLGYGPALRNLIKVRENYPVTLHGVSMNIGSTDALDFSYLKRLKELINMINPSWVSDHLCFTGAHSVNSFDLIPLPFTNEAVNHVTNRISQIQDYIGQRILIENVSSYVSFNEDEMPEWEFIKTIAEKADCGILLDVNNIYVNSQNHNFNPSKYIASVPWHRVGQMHLAGYFKGNNVLIDTHGSDVSKPVWQLYKEVCKLSGPQSTIIERDDNIPELKILENEMLIAQSMYEEAQIETQKSSNSTYSVNT